MKILAIRMIVTSLALVTWTAGVTIAWARTSVSTVRIDVMPGVADKVIDIALAERIPVAVFGEAGLDVREIDATSLSVNGAAVTKREDGSLATYRDVDGDGRVDLLIDVPSSMMHLGARSPRAFLSGRTLDGRSIAGSALLRTVAQIRAERRLAARPDPAERSAARKSR